MRMYFEQAEERRAKFGFFARATNATSCSWSIDHAVVAWRWCLGLQVRGRSAARGWGSPAGRESDAYGYGCWRRDEMAS
jgi:hypothetical protein